MENRLILLLLACLLLCSCGYENGDWPAHESRDELSEQESSEEVSAELSEEVSAELSEEVSTELSEEVSTELSEEVSAELSEAVSTELSEEVSEAVSNEVSEESAYIPSDEELVLISDYIPNIALDIRYATENNFTKQVIYNSSNAFLRYGTLKKLIAVQEELNSLGYSLLVYDAYRPTYAQWRLWEICPDPNFVSDPNKGFSGHSRGNTVDITIITLDGEEVEMPSEFDEFGAAADRDYGDVSEKAAENARLLEGIMEKHGFNGYRKEWWHYSDKVEYEVIE